MKELKDTIKGMQSDNYKERFIAEFQQTAIRFGKLSHTIDDIRLGLNETAYDCSLELLQEQQKYMGLYLGVLCKRAIIENIDLNECWNIGSLYVSK